MSPVQDEPEAAHGAEVRATAAAASTAVATITAKAASNMWIKWSLIAIDHERDALIARRQAETITDSQRLGEPYEAEFHASLIAVTASAFALEAFANHLTEWLGASVPRTVVQKYNGRVPAAVKVIEVVKDSFAVSAHEAYWSSEASTLFELRNDVVHFKPTWNELVSHPTGKSHVVRETVIYSAERASSSVALAIEILTTCLHSPRSDRPQVVEWTGNVPHVGPWPRERHQTSRAL
jgi:hypothetical protein